MSKQSQGSWSIIGAITGGVFLVAFVALMVVGDYAFSPALFLALAVAVAVGVFFLASFHRSPRRAAPSRLTGRVPHRAQASEGAAHPAPAAAQSSHATAEKHPETDATAHESTAHAEHATPQTSMAEAPAPEHGEEATAEPSPDQHTVVGTEPVRLSEAREGQPDDLKRIRGIGPKLEGELHKMGIYHFDQIAGWSAAEVAWMDEHLVEFRGRVSRDDWVGQARRISAGGEGDAPDTVDSGEAHNT